MDIQFGGTFYSIHGELILNLISLVLPFFHVYLDFN